MNTPPQDYRPTRRARLAKGSLLEARLRRDGRRASLTLDGILLEVGTPGRIERRYRALSQPKV